MLINSYSVWMMRSPGQCTQPLCWTKVSLINQVIYLELLCIRNGYEAESKLGYLINWLELTHMNQVFEEVMTKGKQSISLQFNPAQSWVMHEVSVILPVYSNSNVTWVSYVKNNVSEVDFLCTWNTTSCKSIPYASQNLLKAENRGNWSS